MTVSRSKYAVKVNSLYETEPWATEAFLRFFPVKGLKVWEPSAGNHKMADVLKAGGAAEVWTSDIARYERDHDEMFDFLDGRFEPWHGRFEAIIANPPYGPGNRNAARFLENALKACQHGMVAMLVTAKFDFGNTRTHLFRDNPRFVAKIHLLDRISWEGNGKGGTEDHAWVMFGPQTFVHHKPIMLYAGKQVPA